MLRGRLLVPRRTASKPLPLGDLLGAGHSLADAQLLSGKNLAVHLKSAVESPQIHGLLKL